MRNTVITVLNDNGVPLSREGVFLWNPENWGDPDVGIINSVDIRTLPGYVAGKDYDASSQDAEDNLRHPLGTLKFRIDLPFEEMLKAHAELPPAPMFEGQLYQLLSKIILGTELYDSYSEHGLEFAYYDVVGFRPNERHDYLHGNGWEGGTVILEVVAHRIDLFLDKED